MPQADAWVAHLRRQCARWAAAGLPVSFAWRRIDSAPARGQSVEAWAREARYAALAGMARELGADTVLLAHHRQDQAETFLLQALRGGGAAGLSAMPAAVTRDGIRWLRPWLGYSRAAIDAYVKRYRLSHVLDASNHDPRWARSRLRSVVWPQLAAQFAQADASLAAAAARAQEAAACLLELAEIDLQAAHGSDLRLDAWRELSPPRRANLLRRWLLQHLPQGVPESLVQRLLRELPGEHAARWPAGAGQLRRHDGRLSFASVPPGPVESARPARLSLDLSHAGRHTVHAWQGVVEMRSADEPGLPLALLRTAELRTRSGGERFQRHAGTPPRCLKKQFQAARIPAWERDGPLLFSGEQLLYVPGLGVDARAIAPRGTPALVPRWLPD